MGKKQNSASPDYSRCWSPLSVSFTFVFPPSSTIPSSIHSHLPLSGHRCERSWKSERGRASLSISFSLAHPMFKWKGTAVGEWECKAQQTREKSKGFLCVGPVDNETPNSDVESNREGMQECVFRISSLFWGSRVSNGDYRESCVELVHYAITDKLSRRQHWQWLFNSAFALSKC